VREIIFNRQMVKLFLILLSCAPAPSAPPTSVSTSDVTSSSITLQWGAVDCIHRNGDITGYSVQYEVQGSGSTRNISVLGGTATEATISGLQSSTSYSVGVAAVNDAGTGVYSTGHQVLIGSSETMSSAAIVGGAVAIVLIIVVAVTIIIVVTIIMRSRHGRYSLKKEEM